MEESAGWIYGVMMEERGVSAVVWVEQWYSVAKTLKGEDGGESDASF